MRQGEACFSTKKVVQKAFLCIASAFMRSTVNSTVNSAMVSLLYSTVNSVVVNTVQVNELSRQSFSCH